MARAAARPHERNLMIRSATTSQLVALHILCACLALGLAACSGSTPSDDGSPAGSGGSGGSNGDGDAS